MSDTKVQDEMVTRMQIKDKVSTILNVPNVEDWDIIDAIPEANLYLVHYNERANLKVYGELRGIIVDTLNEHVVCRSYPHTPIAVMDEVKLVNDILTIQDETGTVYQIEKKNMQIKRGYEGTLIRIFKHNNQIYFSTRKKINCVHSKWGNSITFYDMYNELVDANPSDFFDKDDPSPPITHLFVLVHPDVQHVSKADLSDGGFSIYLGGKLVRDVDDEKKYQKYLNIDIFSTNKEEMIDIKEANNFLAYGFHADVKLSSDKRLNPGEFIMIYNVVDNAVVNTIKVHSSGYNWRTFVRNNNSNICHQFYKLFNYLRPSETLDQMFPLIPFVSENYISQLLDKHPLIMWPASQKGDVSRGVYRIWASMLLSVPLHKQSLAFNLMRDYQRDKLALKEYVQGMLDYEDIETKDISENLKAIVYQIRNAKYSLTENLYDQMVRYTVKRIDTMRGHNLYGLIRDMKCDQRKIKNNEVCE